MEDSLSLNDFHHSNSDSINDGTLNSAVITESVPTPAELADRYQFIKKLSEDPNENLFLAKSIYSEERVVVNCYDIQSVQDWKQSDSFRTEINNLKTLNIQGVAKLIEVLEYLDLPTPRVYIVHEYIEGKSLENMMSNGYRMPHQKIYKLAVDLLDILEELHALDPPIIHRDIKPANILMKQLPNGDFQPYLINFVSLNHPDVLLDPSVIAGTYGYMPPEQLLGEPVPASDLYALAATIVHLLSNVPPYEMKMHEGGFRLMFEPYLKDVPESVVSFLKQMLKPDTQDRLTQIFVMKERFAQFAQGQIERSNELSYADAASDPLVLDLKNQLADANHKNSILIAFCAILLIMVLSFIMLFIFK